MSISRRTQIGMKLAVSAAAFLCLTMIAAVCLRVATGESKRARGPASLEAGSVFEHRGNLSAAELGMLGSTPLARGRRAVFHEQVFRARAGSEPRQVALNLFPDLTLTAQFQPDPAHMVNEALFVGTILGDDESSVRIMVTNGTVDGTIKFYSNEYRIIDGANGQAIITEAVAR